MSIFVGARFGQNEGRPRPAGLRSRGFTFIELSAVIVILALVATGVMINLPAGLRGDQVRGFRIGLTRIAAQARQDAISGGAPVSVTFDESGGRLQAGAQSTDRQTSTNSVRMPDGFSAREFQLEGANSTAPEWVLRFYPDGTCDSGAIEFAGDGLETVTVVFDPKTGSARVSDSALADVVTAPERWEAGEMELRGGAPPQ